MVAANHETLKMTTGGSEEMIQTVHEFLSSSPSHTGIFTNAIVEGTPVVRVDCNQIRVSLHSLDAQTKTAVIDEINTHNLKISKTFPIYTPDGELSYSMSD